MHGRAGAGVWAPDPPSACGDISTYGTPPARADAIVWGDAGDNEIWGGNHPQIIMGLGGNDIIHGGNSGDCLVGGDGDDQLFGDNAKDVILGGPGNDYLDGGNGKDSLDGGEGESDVCIGGNGKDQIVNCEASAPAPLALQLNSLSGDDPDVEETLPDESTPDSSESAQEEGTKIDEPDPSVNGEAPASDADEGSDAEEGSGGQTEIDPDVADVGETPSVVSPPAAE
jgi:hypothetical protein